MINDQKNGKKHHHEQAQVRIDTMDSLMMYDTMFNVIHEHKKTVHKSNASENNEQDRMNIKNKISNIMMSFFSSLNDNNTCNVEKLNAFVIRFENSLLREAKNLSAFDYIVCSAVLRHINEIRQYTQKTSMRKLFSIRKRLLFTCALFEALNIKSQAPIPFAAVGYAVSCLKQAMSGALKPGLTTKNNQGETIDTRMEKEIKANKSLRSSSTQHQPGKKTADEEGTISRT